MGERKYRVMVAEDEVLQLNSIVRKIHDSDLGFEVVATAQTGDVMRNLIDRQEPDAVFTDIQMPVMTGIELMEYICQNHPYTKVVLISGYSDFEYAKKAIQCKAFEYLLKPVTAEEMNKTLLRLHAALQELKRSSAPDASAAGVSPQACLEYLHDYLQNHYAEEFDMDTISEQLGYHPTYLSRLFEKRYSTSPTKYQTQLRMERAKYLLLHEPEVSVRRISELTGYPDQGYFSRIFKKQTGLSPNQYRAKNT
jgi:two-component system response regulator YesN